MRFPRLYETIILNLYNKVKIVLYYQYALSRPYDSHLERTRCVMEGVGTPRGHHPIRFESEPLDSDPRGR